MKRRQFQLVTIGHITQERKPGLSKSVIGGHSAYVSVAAAQQGIKTGIVAKIEPNFTESLLQPLHQAGVNLQGIIRNEVSTREIASHTEKNGKYIAHNSIEFEDIPENYHNCSLLYICPVERDVRLESLDTIVSLGHFTAVDLAGYGGIDLNKGYRRGVALDKVITKISTYFDFVKIREEDCVVLFGKDKPENWSGRVLECGPEAVLISMADKQIFIYTPDQFWRVPAAEEEIIDMTEYEDVFMAGFLCEYIRSEDILESAVFGFGTVSWFIEKSSGVLSERMPTENQVRNLISENKINKMI